jgi:uncharacterized protein
MIIDAHVHIGREDLISPGMMAFLKTKNLTGENLKKISPQGLLKEMDAAGIDRAIVFPLSFPCTAEEQRVLNDFTLSAVKSHSDRLTGLAVVAPEDIIGSLANLSQSVSPGGLCGIKFHPSMQSFYPNDPRMDPIYAFASDNDLPLLFHQGAGPAGHADKYSQPILMEDVLLKFPKVRLILAHCGRPFYDEVAFLLRKYPRVYADFSANLGRKGGAALLRHCVLLLQVYAGAAERLFFGTDFPIFSPTEYIQQARQALQGGEFGGELIKFSNDEIEGIMGGNAAKLFGLSE